MALMMLVLSVNIFSATMMDEFYPSETTNRIKKESDGATTKLTTVVLNGDISYEEENDIFYGFLVIHAEHKGNSVYGVGTMGSFEMANDEYSIMICNMDSEGNPTDVLYNIAFTEEELQYRDEDGIFLLLDKTEHDKLVSACKNGDVLVFYVDGKIHGIISLTGFTKGYNSK